MTGKSSLAALVSRDLVNRSLQQNDKVVVANFDCLEFAKNGTFCDAFVEQCGVEWSFVKSLHRKGYTVYFVVDEAQAIYQEPSASPPRRRSADFWLMVKHVLNDKAYSIRVLMLAAYGCDLQYRLATPVDIPSTLVLGYDHLSFVPDEVVEYVNTWFKGFTTPGCSAIQFYERLSMLTGGHAGLCAAAISTLNKVYFSCARKSVAQPSPQGWVHLLEYGSDVVFNELVSTRAVQILNTLTSEESEGLECTFYHVGTLTPTAAATRNECLRKGILVQTDEGIEFSSPVIWRYFVRMRVGHIERARHGLTTLPVMIERVCRAINYNSIRETLGRTHLMASPWSDLGKWNFIMLRTAAHQAIV